MFEEQRKERVDDGFEQILKLCWIRSEINLPTNSAILLLMFIKKIHRLDVKPKQSYNRN